MNNIRPVLIVATSNRDKVREISEFLKNVPVEVTMLPDAERVLDGVEGDCDYEVNAIAKATKAAELTGKMSLGEDSGLEVEALDGAPGPLSARFVSPNASPDEKNRALLEELDGVPTEKRQARYVSVVAIAGVTGDLHVFRGECVGSIALETSGEAGFGYDPLFIPDGYDKTIGVLGEEIKSKISHRAAAMAKVRDYFGQNV